MNSATSVPDRGGGAGSEFAGTLLGYALLFVVEGLLLLGGFHGAMHPLSAYAVGGLGAGFFVFWAASKGRKSLAWGIAAGFLLAGPVLLNEWMSIYSILTLSSFVSRNETRSVSGIVCDESGQPIAGAPLWLKPDGDNTPFLIHSGPDGRFLAEFKQGVLQIVIVPLGFTDDKGTEYAPQGDRTEVAVGLNGSPPTGIRIPLMHTTGMARMIDFKRAIQGDQAGEARFGLRIAEGELMQGECPSCDLQVTIRGCQAVCRSPDPYGVTPGSAPWEMSIAGRAGNEVIRTDFNPGDSLRFVPPEGFQPEVEASSTHCGQLGGGNVFYFRARHGMITGRLDFNIGCPNMFPGVTSYSMGEVRVIANPRGDRDLKFQGQGLSLPPLDLPVSLPFRDRERFASEKITVTRSETGWHVVAGPGAAPGALRSTLIRLLPPPGVPVPLSPGWQVVGHDGSFRLVLPPAGDDRPYLAIEYPWPDGCTRPNCNLELVSLSRLIALTNGGMQNTGPPS